MVNIPYKFPWNWWWGDRCAWWSHQFVRCETMFGPWQTYETVRLKIGDTRFNGHSSWELMINVLFVLTPCSESKGFSMARWDCRNAGYPEFSQMLHFCRTHSTTLQWINDPKQDQYGLVVHLWVKFPESGHSQLGHHSGVITKDLHCYIVLPSLESWLVRGILPLFLALFQVSESL